MVDVGGFASPAFIDIDGDGVKTYSLVIARVKQNTRELGSAITPDFSSSGPLLV